MNDDLISRQAVFELIEHYNSDGLGSVFVDFRHGIKFADAINELPSVTPTQNCVENALGALDCLIDRPCDVCKFHEENGCTQWVCVFCDGLFGDMKTKQETSCAEQEPKTEQFAKWVASEIFDEMWEYNKDAFAEIACRKLAKLGIVRAKDDEWELVEPQERSE